MRILVTGAGGYVGGALVARLAGQGHKVVAHYRKPPEKRQLTSSIVASDLASTPPKVNGQIDLLVHAAAAAAADHEPGGGDPNRYLHDNIIATKNLAEWAAGSQVRAVLMLSSISVYGNINEEMVTPHSPINNPSLYGASKLFAEYFLTGNKTATPVIVARLPGIIGPSPPRNWLHSILTKMQAGKEVAIFNPDAPFNNAVHVDDLADWAGRLANAPWRGSHVVTLGANTPLTVAAAVARLRRALSSTVPIVTRQAPKSSFRISIAAAERLGFRPMTTAAMIDQFAFENRANNE